MSTNKITTVLMIFLDGVGIGKKIDSNPFAIIENLAPLAHFQQKTSKIIFEGRMIPTDARLGVEGRPQSASGQTTIYTGINAPKMLGHHKQGFPKRKLTN